MWIAYPKSAAIFWTGVGLYMGVVDPAVRDKLPDTRSRLAWWQKMWRRGAQTISPVGVTAAAVALYAYKQTDNKNFLYGALVAFASYPFTAIAMGPQTKFLAGKANHIAEGGFLTKKDEEKVDAEIQDWTNKHRIRCLIPIVAAILFGIA